jgi:hypothetical protein
MDDAKLVDSWDGRIAVKCFIKLPLFFNSPLRPARTQTIEAWFVFYTPGFGDVYSTQANGFTAALPTGAIIVPGPFYEEEAAIEAVVAAAKIEVARSFLPSS